MTSAITLQVKGNKTFAPLSNLNSETSLIQIWQAVSKASQFLDQGKRLENLSWRLWSLQALGDHQDDVAVLNRGRMAGHVLGREKGPPTLLPPSGAPRAKCCKIDPSIPCVHKKPRSTSRSVFAAGPSVPLRSSSHASAESSHNHGSDGPVASSSRVTIDADPASAQSAAQPQPKQNPPLWPISSVSPNAHLAPVPFLPVGTNLPFPSNLQQLQGGAPSAAQMMLSALIESLLSAGVAPSTTAQTLQQLPAGMMTPIGDQGFGPFGIPPSQPGTLPSTPMEWTMNAASSFPPGLDNNMTRASLKARSSPATGRAKRGSAVERRVNDLRQQMQLSGSPSGPSSAPMSPTVSEQSTALDQNEGASLPLSAQSTTTTSKGSRKKASVDLGAGAGSTGGSKGKGKAIAPSSDLPDGGASTNASSGEKDTPPSAANKRAPMQTTSSSVRKAASTVASPSAPPDLAPPQCSNCGVKKTPLWRRCGEQHELLCNACGLYWAMHKTHRPEKLKHHRGRNGGGVIVIGEDEDGNPLTMGGSTSEDDGPETLCSNCGTSTTPLWRKDKDGHTVCNACGLFMKLHGSARPVKMRADVIKKRLRYDIPLSPTGSGMSPLPPQDSPTGENGSGSAYAGPSSSVPMPAQPVVAGTDAGQQQALGMSSSMDLDTTFANLHGATGTGSGLPATSPMSTQSLFSSFSSSSATGAERTGASTSFAPFHPGSDTAGRLTTTGSHAGGVGAQTHTPTTFAQQQQRQRHEQDQQWAHAAGFLLPPDPVGGNAFNFGQALWGCDPGVIGNWNSGTSPSSLAGLGGGSGPGAGAGAGGGGGTVNLGASLMNAEGEESNAGQDSAVAGAGLSGLPHPDGSTDSLQHPLSLHLAARGGPGEGSHAATQHASTVSSPATFEHLFDLGGPATTTGTGTGTGTGGGAAGVPSSHAASTSTSYDAFVPPMQTSNSSSSGSGMRAGPSTPADMGHGHLHPGSLLHTPSSIGGGIDSPRAS
ncbi:hypothetical protein V8E36_004522 [Tilletia maclaganii]